MISKNDIWDWRRFAELFKYSPVEAFEYRKQMLWDDIPEEYRKQSNQSKQTKEKIVKEIKKEEKKENKKEKNVVDMDIKEKKELLKKNLVKFHINLWEKKINWLLIENNLI